MTRVPYRLLVAAGLAVFWSHASLAAPTPEQLCEAGKNQQTGKYALCRAKARAKLVRTGDAARYAASILACETKFATKWAVLEQKAVNKGAACPSAGDQVDVEALIRTQATRLANRLAGTRFVDNGDGTVSDTTTGLIWEKKTGVVGTLVDCTMVTCSDPHDVNNLYDWSFGPGGWLVEFLLLRLDYGTTGDGGAITGCFADHCDWRLPTITELQTIVDPTLGECGGGSGPCIDESVFGPTLAVPFSAYWSSTWDEIDPSLAWAVSFQIGVAGPVAATTKYPVRAVRDE